MNEHFIIRKNKSLKELKPNQNHVKQPFAFCQQRVGAPKDNHPKNNQKIIYLQPLMKTKDTPYRQPKQTLQVKLDNTQPVNMKSISLALTRQKQEVYHMQHLELNIVEKQTLLEKQNRPASMNEIKYPSLAKIKTNFYQTQKYQSLKAFAQFGTNKDFKRAGQTKHTQEQQRKQTNTQVMSKMRIIKESSRSRLVKLHRQQRQKDKASPELNHQKSFRKGIIDKIMQHKKKHILVDISDFIQKNQEPIKSPTVAATIQHKPQVSESYHSPKLKKDDLNWDNCSTIKEQEESCQSFLSKNPFEDCSESQQFQNIQITLNQNKPIFNRRPKVQVEKIKKKFPQNFFK